MGSQKKWWHLKIKIKLVAHYIQNYQNKWNTWTEWIQAESQNQFYIINQKDEHQSEVKWRDGRKIWDRNRPSGLIFDRKKKKKKVSQFSNTDTYLWVMLILIWRWILVEVLSPPVPSHPGVLHSEYFYFDQTEWKITKHYFHNAILRPWYGLISVCKESYRE